ncbi:MAG TPA: TetR/AcrR family transcriptional regulator [Myxococcales bacterium]|nr:TetR/AcrR family transcriptional regulator [Myxococcales bacterium]
MAIGTERRQERSRGRILSAARELILRHGVENLSLRAVAERAGYSPASLYEYFAGKDDLIATVAQEVAGRLDQRMGSVPAGLPPERRLIRLGAAYVDFARAHSEDFLLLFHRLKSARKSAREAAGPGSPYARVLGAAQEGCRSGVLRASEGFGPEEMAYALWALAHGMAMLQLTHLKAYQADFEESDRKALERLVAAFAG